MREVGLLVELGLVQSEGVDNVEDLLGVVVDGFISTVLGRWVRANVCCPLVCGQRSTCLATHTDVVVANGDLLAVGLVDGAVNLLQVVGVGDQLITGDDVLWRMLVWHYAMSLAGYTPCR